MYPGMYLNVVGPRHNLLRYLHIYKYINTRWESMYIHTYVRMNQGVSVDYILRS